MLDKNTVLSICEDVSSVIVEKLKIKYSKYFSTIEYGKFYKFQNVMFCYSKEPLSLYKFSTFEYLHENIDLYDTYVKKHKEYWLEITDDTMIQKYLIQESKRRGYVDGTKYQYYNHIVWVKDCKNFRYNGTVGYQYLTDGHGGSVFYDGGWAEII